MGTHISRVKSVDLDAWTDEQMKSVLQWGNVRANKSVHETWENARQIGPQLKRRQVLGIKAGAGTCSIGSVSSPRSLTGLLSETET